MADPTAAPASPAPTSAPLITADPAPSTSSTDLLPLFKETMTGVFGLTPEQVDKTVEFLKTVNVSSMTAPAVNQNALNALKTALGKGETKSAPATTEPPKMTESRKPRPLADYFRERDNNG